MQQCSICTAGSSYCSTELCMKCHTIKVHICQYCAPLHTTSLCIACYKRPHVCLSKCNNGCIIKKPKCRCKQGPIRFQVNKDNHNKDKWFWTCNPVISFVGNNFCIIKKRVTLKRQGDVQHSVSASPKTSPFYFPWFLINDK